MAAIIALAQGKGGVGKTTSAVATALELAERGYRIRILDCDTNHHSARFGLVCQSDGVTVVPELNPDLAASAPEQPQVTEKTLGAEIDRATADGCDAIIIDLPGILSRVGLVAMMRSHLVLVPVRDSMLDAEDAVSLLADVEVAQQTTGRRIEARAFFSDIAPGQETTWGKAVRDKLEDAGLPVFNVKLMHREAYKDMLAAGAHPARIDLDLYDPKRRRAKREALTAAADNIAALADEILAVLEAMTAKA